jgi:hypothetical protein
MVVVVIGIDARLVLVGHAVGRLKAIGATGLPGCGDRVDAESKG